MARSIPKTILVTIAMALSQTAFAQDAQMILDTCRQTNAVHKLQRQFDETVGVAVNSLQLTATTIERVSQNLITLLASESLLLAYQREFAEIDAQGALNIRRWCLSPIGKRIIESEEKAPSDEDDAVIMRRALTSIRNAKNPENRGTAWSNSSIAAIFPNSHLKPSGWWPPFILALKN